jgi:DNA-binding response OmpR family regulator
MQTTKRRILMVDDDEMMLSTMKRYIEGTGRFEVRTQSKSTKLRDALSDYSPELIILDLMMPDMDGGDLAAMLKNDARTKDTPVLFFTSSVSKEEIEKSGGTIAGHTFMAKPCEGRELLKKIDQLLAAGSR